MEVTSSLPVAPDPSPPSHPFMEADMKGDRQRCSCGWAGLLLCTRVPGREAGAEIQPVFHWPTWAPMGWHLQRDISMTKAPELAATPGEKE